MKKLNKKQDNVSKLRDKIVVVKEFLILLSMIIKMMISSMPYIKWLIQWIAIIYVTIFTQGS